MSAQVGASWARAGQVLGLCPYGTDELLLSVAALWCHGAAAESSSALGAKAYAVGNSVAFSKSPDLHTAAHEAARERLDATPQLAVRQAALAPYQRGLVRSVSRVDAVDRRRVLVRGGERAE